jgi:hypothetical protein
MHSRLHEHQQQAVHHRANWPGAPECRPQPSGSGPRPGSCRPRAGIVPPGIPAAERAWILAQLETFADARAERYRRLLAILDGQPVPPSVIPAVEYLITALRADLS